MLLAGLGRRDDVDLAGPWRVRRGLAWLAGARLGGAGQAVRDDAGLVVGGVRAGGRERGLALLPRLDQLPPALFPLGDVSGAGLHVGDQHRQRGQPEPAGRRREGPHRVMRLLRHVGIVQPGLGAQHPQVAGERAHVVVLDRRDGALGVRRRVGQRAVALPDHGAACPIPRPGRAGAGIDPVARRVAQTPRPGAWLGLPLGRLGRLGRLTARPARSASAARRPWAVPAGSGLSRTVRTATGIPGAGLTRTRARLSRTARPHWPGSSGSSGSPGPARRGLTVAGVLVAGPVRPRVPWSEFARARSVRVPAWRIRTRAGAGRRLPGRAIGSRSRPVRRRAWFSRRERVRGECPRPERLRPGRPRLRGPVLLRPVLLGPVRARPVLFGAMLVRPVPVSAVPPGAALLSPILLSAVRLRSVLVRPVPAGVVLLSPVLLWPALGGVVLLRSVPVSAVPARPVLLRTVLLRTVLLRTVLLRTVLLRPVLLRTVLLRPGLAGMMLLRPVLSGPAL